MFDQKANEVKMHVNKVNASLEQAVKTMRKLPVFGYTANGAHVPDYEWPTAEDILAMPGDQPIRAAAINWKKCDQISTVMGGLQLILSNGKMSPQYVTKVQNDQNFERVDVDFSKVRRIRGTSNGFWVSQIHFHDANNNEIKRVASYQQAFGDDQVLQEGEEIIGIYGTRNAHNNYFATIGFIVWKPPK